MPLLPFHRLPYVRLHLRIRVPTIAVLHNGSSQLPLYQHFSATAPVLAKPLPPRRPLLDNEITESFLKGSGPGGQKINKTSSAVQLKHLPTGIVVKCQETRSRSQNRKMARRALQERIEEVELGELARTRVRAREVAGRKKSADKKKRRKYRALKEGKDGEVEREEGVEGGQGGDAEGRALAEGEAPTESTHAEGSGKAG